MRLLTVGVVGSFLLIATLAGAEDPPPASDGSSAEPSTSPQSSDASTEAESSPSPRGEPSEGSGPEPSSPEANASESSPPEASSPSSAESGTPSNASSTSASPAEPEPSSRAEPSPAPAGEPTEATEDAKASIEAVVPAEVKAETEPTVTVVEDEVGEEILFAGPEPEPAASGDAPPQSQPAQTAAPSESSAASSGSRSDEDPSSEPPQDFVPAPVAAAAQEVLAKAPLEALPVQLPLLSPPALPALELFAAPGHAPGDEPGATAVETGPQVVGAASVLTEPVPVDPLAVAVAATIVLGVTASAVASSAPGWQKAVVRWARWFGLGFLFSRLSDDALLNHPRRSEIHEYVLHNPGERLEAVRRALRLSNGSMLHHVRILDDRDLVRVVRDGPMTRLYPAGPRIEPAPYVPAARRRLLRLVESSPGRTQREIAALFGASERMVSYHLAQLRAKGLVDVRRDGTAKRCFPLAHATP